MTQKHEDETLEAFETSYALLSPYMSYKTLTDMRMRIAAHERLVKALGLRCEMSEYSPEIGDGKIWNGFEWIRIAPGFETFSMLNMQKDLAATQLALVACAEALDKYARYHSAGQHISIEVLDDHAQTIEKARG